MCLVIRSRWPSWLTSASKTGPDPRSTVTGGPGTNTGRDDCENAVASAQSQRRLADESAPTVAESGLVLFIQEPTPGGRKNCKFRVRILQIVCLLRSRGRDLRCH